MKEASARIFLVCCQKAVFKSQGRTLMEEIEEVTNRKISRVHVLKELVSLKFPYYPKPIDSIPIKIPMVAFFFFL